jgi:hypothetical protein
MKSTLHKNAIILAPQQQAGMAELVDAPDSKSGDGDIVWVRFPLPAPELCQYRSKGDGYALLNYGEVSIGKMASADT